MNNYVLLVVFATKYLANDVHHKNKDICLIDHFDPEEVYAKE